MAAKRKRRVKNPRQFGGLFSTKAMIVYDNVRARNPRWDFSRWVSERLIEWAECTAEERLSLEIATAQAEWTLDALKHEDRIKALKERRDLLIKKETLSALR